MVKSSHSLPDGRDALNQDAQAGLTKRAGHPRLSPRSEADRDYMQAKACRHLWASVVLTVLNDSWHAVAKHPQDTPKLRERALSYFRSRDGRTVVALAGITADPERLADAAVDLTARDRTKVAFGLDGAA